MQGRKYLIWDVSESFVVYSIPFVIEMTVMYSENKTVLDDAGGRYNFSS